ncbi:hypothetical protein EA472_21190 [Natrarchaeobius oligotrophus]|uniref:Uncharacterized protein n=1 Tax=Natrarchaeobius chitinivorans TaxID=1679083 RepID=A0A3N6NAM0_NATCH|nr:hypothetical protein EA472_21190 [Natrarchaeobius chitinivorans]
MINVAQTTLETTALCTDPCLVLNANDAALAAASPPTGFRYGGRHASTLVRRRPNRRRLEGERIVTDSERFGIRDDALI